MLIEISTGLPWDPSEPIGEIRYPLNIEQFWSQEDLAAIGLAVYAPTPLPEPATLETVIVEGSGVGGSGGG